MLHTELELGRLPLVLFDFEHSNNLCEVFLVLLDIALITVSIDIAPKVASAHLQLVHFPRPIAFEFFHIFL